MKTPIDQNKLSDMVRSKRGSRGLRDIVLDIGEVSAATVSRIERGACPDLMTFILLCRWLRVSPEEFIIWDFDR